MDALYDLVHQLASAQNIKLGMAPPPPPETHGVISRMNAFEQSLQRAAVVEPVEEKPVEPPQQQQVAEEAAASPSACCATVASVTQEPPAASPSSSPTSSNRSILKKSGQNPKAKAKWQQAYVAAGDKGLYQKRRCRFSTVLASTEATPQKPPPEVLSSPVVAFEKDGKELYRF